MISLIVAYASAAATVGAYLGWLAVQQRNLIRRLNVIEVADQERSVNYQAPAKAA
jgi:hypothetical protein